MANNPSSTDFSRKDLILLQKYKDDNYRRALVDSIVCLTKHSVYQAAKDGQTMSRSSINWAYNKLEVADLQKEEQRVREILKESFKDAKIDVDTTHINLIFYEFWEITVKVNWA